MKFRKNTLVIESIEEQLLLEDSIDAKLDFVNIDDEDEVNKAYEDYKHYMNKIRELADNTSTDTKYVYKPVFEWRFKSMIESFAYRDEANCMLFDKIERCLEEADIISFEIPEEEQTTDYPKEEEDRERCHGIE